MPAYDLKPPPFVACNKTSCSSIGRSQRFREENQVHLDGLPATGFEFKPDYETMLNRQVAFGYSTEDLKFVIAPMVGEPQFTNLTQLLITLPKVRTRRKGQEVAGGRPRGGEHCGRRDLL